MVKHKQPAKMKEGINEVSPFPHTHEGGGGCTACAVLEGGKNSFSHLLNGVTQKAKTAHFEVLKSLVIGLCDAESLPKAPPLFLRRKGPSIVSKEKGPSYPHRGLQE